MNTLTGIFFMVLTVPILANEWSAEDAYAESDLKEQVHEHSLDCAKQANPDPWDIALFFVKDVCAEQGSAKPATRCWISCIMRKMRILNVTRDGQKMKAFFDRFAMKERVDEMRGEPETKTGFLQSMESCAAQAEEGSKVHCDVGYEMLRCYCRAMKQNKATPAPRQEEK